MNEDLQRRTVLAGVGTALAGAVAGCSGDGGSGDTDERGNGGGDDPTASDDTSTAEMAQSTATSDDGMESTPTPTATPGPPMTEGSMGTLAENAISEFEFLGWRGEARGAGIFNVYMTLQNDGSEPVDITNYTWAAVPYDESGEKVTVSAAGPVTAEFEGDLPAGESGEVSYHLRVDDTSKIASYEISLTCSGYNADGTYCPE